MLRLLVLLRLELLLLLGLGLGLLGLLGLLRFRDRRGFRGGFLVPDVRRRERRLSLVAGNARRRVLDQFHPDLSFPVLPPRMGESPLVGVPGGFPGGFPAGCAIRGGFPAPVAVVQFIGITLFHGIPPFPGLSPEI
jgi:hypothetical protein